jgi:hypothetical protein
VFNDLLYTPYFSVLPGNGDGTFGAPLSSLTNWNYGDLNFVAVADFNGDGKPDLAAGSFVLFGNGDGTFRMGTYLYQGQAAAVGDFNGDGFPDVVLLGGDQGVSILSGNGDGSFKAPTGFLAGIRNWFAAVADFNGDGKPDLAVIDQQSDNVTVLTNTTP